MSPSFVQRASPESDVSHAWALPPLEQPISRTDRVRERLRRAILDGTLQPGQALVERELADMLGVSKTPVREALKQLKATGLVELNAYLGVSVRRLDVTTIGELYAARAEVEPGAVRMVTQRHDDPAIADASRALDDAQALLREGDIATLSMANRRFHRALYAACGNTFLCAFLDQLQDLAAFIAAAGWRQRATADDEATEHAGILDAVRLGDAELAEQRTRLHIERSAQTVLDALGDQDAT